MRRLAWLGAGLLAGLAAAAWSGGGGWPGSRPASVVVSSKLDTEGGVLGYVILRALEARGIPVTDKVQLGATPILRQAIIQGQVDIYPEYTGNAAFFFNKPDLPVWKRAAAGYALAKRLDFEAHRIVWLSPASADNTWSIAVRRDVAEPNGLRTMSDFGRYVAGGGAITLAASTEFVSSPATLPAFEAAYGFRLAPAALITLSGGDTAATIAAAAQGVSGANAAMAYGTDGAVAPLGLLAMADDKGVQPVYLPAPIVREAVLAAHPEIAAILKPVFEALDLATLRELNGRVQLGGEPAARVAAEFLARKGFGP
ncbi:glycine betaine ABC transporter substrate-binding protein OsmF [Methylobacterium nigriterrae]|uniref:glycine betaine ABC transporter substrate-binding protein OsmF n=1 Tax=Methylobacterium nigriterrae TaxID=3127512 RepID=UPI0030132127